MDQLIFIGIIVVFSILNEIAKKKKAEALRQQQGLEPGEEPYELMPEELEWQFEPEAEEPRTFEGEGGVSRGSGAPAPSNDAQPAIPRTVWEEIAAIAAGQPLPVPAPEPAPVVMPAPPRPVEVEDRRRERGPARPDHEVHSAHAKYGTPVSERLRPLDTPEMHRAPGRSEEVRSVLNLLSGGGESLRQAIILQEVLGSPVSLRDDE